MASFFVELIPDIASFAMHFSLASVMSKKRNMKDL
jgi:hypothetical protein